MYGPPGTGKTSTILDKDGYLYGSADNTSFKIKSVSETAITITLRNGNEKTISFIKPDEQASLIAAIENIDDAVAAVEAATAVPDAPIITSIQPTVIFSLKTNSRSNGGN